MRLALLAVLFPLVVAAQDEKPTDLEGSKDHPAVKRYPGAWISEFEEKEFESFSFPTADTAEGVTSKTVEGKYYSATLNYPPKVSCTQVRRNYENALKAVGLTMHTGKNAPHERGWGGNNLAWISAEGRANGKGPTLFVVVSCGEGDGVSGFTYVVEKEQMEQKVEIDAGEMAAEIERAGHVALYGITFATGKAEISPESAKTLAQIGKLLELKKDWRLRVEGHTDNVGASKANLELSKKRAAAVKAWLVKNHKVADARLSTEGFGDTRPLAPNTTDEGKASNRRVELTKL